MKYILIIGSSNAGKSTTIDNVCKKLKPSTIQILTSENTFKKVAANEDILNGTYIIEVNGRIILVVAGAPTEQKKSITVLIEICIKLKIKIDFALVVMRTFEKREGFNTKSELKKFGESILEERIWRVNNENYKETKEWQDRINKIYGLIKTTLQLNNIN